MNKKCFLIRSSLRNSSIAVIRQNIFIEIRASHGRAKQISAVLFNDENESMSKIIFSLFLLIKLPVPSVGEKCYWGRSKVLEHMLGPKQSEMITDTL